MAISIILTKCQFHEIMKFLDMKPCNDFEFYYVFILIVLYACNVMNINIIFSMPVTLDF